MRTYVSWRTVRSIVALGLLLTAVAVSNTARPALTAELPGELSRVDGRIVYETFYEDNWELFRCRPDGSDSVNLTKTPDFHELYPRVSPDGTRVCFTADEGVGAAKIRNVYYMNLDGTDRTLVARNARQACWKSDGSAIAYLGGEFDAFSIKDFATKGIFIYDLAAKSIKQHANKELYHLYNLCWTSDGKWFLATVHGGMGYRHAILAIEAGGMGVFDLDMPGCRPDVSPDGKQVVWGASDWVLRAGELDFSGPKPTVVNRRDLVTSKKPMKIYHADWSPDGKYVTFARGPARKVLGRIPEIVGVRAKDWNICVADATTTDRWTPITTNGFSNKEPDWAPAQR